jgi:AcrR family transcriptional regulator
MAEAPPPRRRQARRTASERAIISAFEQLFRRHGAHGVGVNAVLDNAGVGKRLLYEYFGDLEGLAAAWARERTDPLGLHERRASLRGRLAALPAHLRVGALLADYLAELRDHPWATQVLLAELQSGHPLARSMREIRRQIGEGYEGLLVECGATEGADAMALAYILHAAANYLALRARFAPDYNGLDLSRAGDWQAALDMFERVAALSPAGAKHPASRRPPARKPRTGARVTRGTGRAGASRQPAR